MEDYHWKDPHDFNTQSPFFKKIMNKPIPHQFKMPLVKYYDSTTNTIDHLEGYIALMRLQRTSDALLYLAFPVTLKKATRMWFSSLLPGSIYSFYSWAIRWWPILVVIDHHPRIMIVSSLSGKKKERHYKAMWHTSMQLYWKLEISTSPLWCSL